MRSGVGNADETKSWNVRKGKAQWSEDVGGWKLGS